MKTTTLDVKGLSCPLPVLRAAKAVKGLMEGDLLVVLATDPSASTDFEAFCETTGHELVEHTEKEGVLRIVIRCSATRPGNR